MYYYLRSIFEGISYFSICIISCILLISFAPIYYLGIYFDKNVKKKRLYNKLYLLTSKKCNDKRRNKKCFSNGCCSREYCDLAEKNLDRVGLVLPRNERHLFLDNRGQCLVSPEYRPLCTVHVCDDSLRDSSFEKKYWKLRQALSVLELEDDRNE